MPTQAPKVPTIPGPDVPMTLPDGKPNPVWYEFMKKITDILKIVRGEIP